MTALVVIASVTMIAASFGLYFTKHWQFERAFFVGLLGAVVLGLYGIQQKGEENTRHEAEARETANQAQNDVTNKKIISALIIGCNQTYKDIGGPVNKTHKEIRAIANAAAADAKRRLKTPGQQFDVREAAKRAIVIWSALASAAAPVPKKDCALAVPKELRPLKKETQ